MEEMKGVRALGAWLRKQPVAVTNNGGDNEQRSSRETIQRWHHINGGNECEVVAMVACEEEEEEKEHKEQWLRLSLHNEEEEEREEEKEEHEE
ncbi:uncharacterized protein HKW66_Vig0178350 [Vigna angularis]|uniref:Uncharacterized protein n=1 Tax=Phaseolus angularis TaxID=3914 RepID=A0A8T0K0T9_PHAAN|nr:uncharacterized protein HKW66_Vig0178350 [Vigna angularis]